MGHSSVNGAVVCKSWLDVINGRSLLHDIIFCVVGENASKILSCLTRLFVRIRFENVSINDYILEFLKQFRNEFIALYFTDCSVDIDRFDRNPEDRIPCCDNLLYLTMTGVNAFLFFASLPKLKALHFDCRFVLRYHDLCEMEAIIPSLAELNLGGVVCNPNVYISIQTGGKRVQEQPSDRILSFPVIRNFIANRRGTLTRLSVGKTDLPPEALIEISEISDLKLEKMVFNSHFLPDLGRSTNLEEFCRNQRHLTHVNLKELSRLTDHGLISVCHNLQNLQILEFSSRHLIDRGIVEVFKLEKLRSLCMPNCIGISPSTFHQAVSQTEVTRLVCLNLEQTLISDAALCTLLLRNKNIEYLYVNETRVSDATLWEISRHLTKLILLNLSGCPGISDAGLTGEVEWDNGIRERGRNYVLAEERPEEEDASADAEERPEEEDASADAEERPKEEDASADAEERPEEEEDASADAEERPEEEDASADAEERPEEEDASADAEERPEEEDASADAEERPEEEDASADAEERPEEEDASADAEERPEEEDASADAVPISNLKKLKWLDLSNNKRLTHEGLLKSIRFQHLKDLFTPPPRVTESFAKALFDQNPSLRRIDSIVRKS
ncbi:f-box domain-containing protein [Caerostris darwini]|uniref:F-box domain-containing protein n=1 Tax=Caerostris darwini TaxID=1538125 RepID=A0AAV4VZ28_9ARAC|nr:f-box domain-containing protein [Caerostris darwini]